LTVCSRIPSEREILTYVYRQLHVNNIGAIKQFTDVDTIKHESQFNKFKRYANARY